MSIQWLECFSELVEMAVLPQTRYLKDIMKSSLANYKYEGPPCVPVSGDDIQQQLLLAEDTTCS